MDRWVTGGGQIEETHSIPLQYCFVRGLFEPGNSNFIYLFIFRFGRKWRKNSVCEMYPHSHERPYLTLNY